MAWVLDPLRPLVVAIHEEIKPQHPDAKVLWFGPDALGEGGAGIPTGVAVLALGRIRLAVRKCRRCTVYHLLPWLHVLLAGSVQLAHTSHFLLVQRMWPGRRGLPASNVRKCQPVTEVAREVGRLCDLPVFENLLLKEATGQSLKNLETREQKLEAIGNSLNIYDVIPGQGRWDVLLVDDLYDSGASMHAACTALRRHPKIADIYVAALTWK
ncbi:hypothetical protein [Comamonas sp. 26]|uniref:hypothetical protein n=1 Tax=Comamonas sp. 26 TaxID=2035201 RepID=UPI000C686396|nr:hypothetical protein [Comamonas sp. 26]PIG08783.1 hypothetical protein CLU84_1654 [Comamonas sp. 26]